MKEMIIQALFTSVLFGDPPKVILNNDQEDPFLRPYAPAITERFDKFIVPRNGGNVSYKSSFH